MNRYWDVAPDILNILEELFLCETFPIIMMNYHMMNYHPTFQQIIREIKHYLPKFLSPAFCCYSDANVCDWYHALAWGEI